MIEWSSSRWCKTVSNKLSNWKWHLQLATNRFKRFVFGWNIPFSFEAHVNMPELTFAFAQRQIYIFNMLAAEQLHNSQLKFSIYTAYKRIKPTQSLISFLLCTLWRVTSQIQYAIVPAIKVSSKILPISLKHVAIRASSWHRIDSRADGCKCECVYNAAVDGLLLFISRSIPFYYLFCECVALRSILVFIKYLISSHCESDYV